MANTTGEVRKRIMEGKYDIPWHVPEGAQSLIHEFLMVDSMQRSTLEQIMGHWWLSQGEEASPSPDQALPKLLDSAIITTMFDMGYGPHNTWVSLSNKKYDDAMATYLLFKHQRTQGAGCKCQVKPRAL